MKQLLGFVFDSELYSSVYNANLYECSKVEVGLFFTEEP